MALTATIFKATVDISDIRRHYYQQHRLTLARHPSETDERMMLRLLAFTLFASESLHFTRGLSNDDEPDLWQKNLSDEIELWIELGQPSAKRLRRAFSLAKHVLVISYGDRAGGQWWKEQENALRNQAKLTVAEISDTHLNQLSELTERNMQLQVTIDDNAIWVSNPNSSIELTLTALQGDITTLLQQLDSSA